MQEKVSVIVPLYQAKKYLNRCVQSIRNQTYKNLEIILVDDGSDDDSLDLCWEYAREDSRIQVIHKENGGVSSARNAGFAAMSGDYLLMVDADDYIKPEMIRELWGAAQSSGAQLAVGGLEFTFESGKPSDVRCPEREFSGSREEFVKEVFLELYDKQLMNNQNNKLYDASLIRQNQICYEERMSINEDIWFCMKMLELSSRVVCLPKTYLYYWQHSEAESLVTKFYPNGVDTCFTLLEAVQSCMKQCRASADVVNKVNNRMLFHICGFAGLAYSRSCYTNQQCYLEIRALANRAKFQTLLRETKPEGSKNQIAAFVLRNRWCRLYHWMCRVLYSKARENAHER